MRTDRDDARDQAHWDAVDEAAELLQELHYVEALLALRDVIKADPMNPYAYNHLGTALFETEKLEPARDAYRAALRVSPNFLGARVALSNTLRMLGDAKGALAEAKEALRRFPKDADAMHAAGLAHAALGQRQEATRELEGFLDAAPEAEVAIEVRQILEMIGLAGDGEPVEFE